MDNGQNTNIKKIQTNTNQIITNVHFYLLNICQEHFTKVNEIKEFILRKSMTMYKLSVLI